MAGNNDKNNEQVIRLDDILYIVMKHHKTVFGIAVIGLLVGVLVSFAFYVKGLAKIEYYVTASIAVTSTNQDGLFSANSSDPNASDIHLAEDMTDAVIYVCKSDVTLNAAAERLQLIGVNAEDIKPRLTLAQYEKTQIIEMRLVWDNAEEGMLILNAITDVVPNILINTLKLGDVSVVNPPKVKTSSLSFIDVKIVAICTLLGAFASAGFFLVKYFIHPTFLHSDDVKDRYDLEILGEIPGAKNYFSKKVNSFSANEFSSVQEYFSACAHALIYRLQDIDNVCVYFTSSAAQEGKTSITANVGFALADLGYKVLLMDMDVRNPSLASKFMFEKDDKHCLNAIVRGNVDVHDAIVKIGSNLDILPTVLEEERLRLDSKVIEIISSAKPDYDFVLIDTAPVGQVSDSMSINQAADCALFVIRQDQVWISTVSESISRLRKSGIAILGAIMNDTKGGANIYYQYNQKQLGDSPYVHFDDDRATRKKKHHSESLEDVGLTILKRRNNKKEQAEAMKKAAEEAKAEEIAAKETEVKSSAKVIDTGESAEATAAQSSESTDTEDAYQKAKALIAKIEAERAAQKESDSESDSK